MAIVAAAHDFLSTLSELQRDTAIFEFGDVEQRARWSNFPEGFFQRAGVRWGELDIHQQGALTRVLGTILSPAGLAMIEEQMLADDQVAEGRGGNFGSANYYVAFLGEPSVTAPWMLQFGGHHLALNATMVGANVTLSPTLTGGQPIQFSAGGRNIYIVEREVAAATTLLESLSDAQRQQATIGTRTMGPLLGPGKDGEVLPPEGLSGSELGGAQQIALLALIEARLGILNANDLASAMEPIEANLDQTYFAWSGSESDPLSAYWRVSGPTVVLEFSPQERDGDPANHLHNIYRDPANEYGAAWIAAN